MGGLSAWILSIVGVVLIGILVEIILPKGQTAKFIKGILAIFTVFVIISPICKISVDNLEFNDIFNFSEININSEFIEQVNKDKIVELEGRIEDLLFENGYEEVSILIDANIGKKIEINKLYVDISKMVLSSENLNINKYTNITAIIKSVIDVKKENIVFNEWRFGFKKGQASKEVWKIFWKT